MRVYNKISPRAVQAAIDGINRSYTGMSVIMENVDTWFVDSRGRQVKARISKVLILTYLCYGLDLIGGIVDQVGPRDGYIVPYANVRKDFNHLWKI